MRLACEPGAGSGE
jgi:hypothetical protein